MTHSGTSTIAADSNIMQCSKMQRFSDDMKLWLFDLAHGNLNHAQIIRGFLKYYALHDMTMGNVLQDIIFHTIYGVEGAEKAKEAMETAFRQSL